jgi:sRNA-binding carbon storage regulator CsrA
MEGTIMNIYEDILKVIQKCEDDFAKIGIEAQNYIDLHDEYIEKTIKDAKLLKDKMKEKVARVINED